MGTVIEDSVDSLRVYQTSGKRHAKLVELLNEDLSPKYVFSDSSSDFKNPAESSELIFKTYRNNVGKKEVRDLALKTFEESQGKNYLENLMKSKSHADIVLRRTNINNFYNLFSKGFWEDKLVGRSKALFETMVLGITSSGTYNLADENYALGSIATGIGLFAGIFWEGIRRSAREGENIEEINQNISSYKNFKSNIGNANILVASPEGAHEIIEEVKRDSSKGRYSKIDTGLVNLDLLNAYNTE